MESTGRQYSDIKGALDESSRFNRRLLLTFSLFEVYMLVIVGSTSDMQLLIPQSSVRLPLISIEIPLLAFYFIAPIFVIAIHFYLLFNLLQHSQKLFFWSKEASFSEKKVLLHPFLFNFLVRFKTGQINYYLLRSMLYTMTYFFPLALLVLTQLRFSKYHSLPMTLWHFMLVLLDLILVMAYWHRIINHEFTDDQNEELKDLWKCQIRPLFRNLSKIIIMAVPLVTFLFLIIWFVDKSDLILGYIDSLFERASVEAGTKAIPFYFNPRDYLVRLFQSWPLAGILSLYLTAYFFVLGSNWKRIWSDNFLQNIWMISWKTILLVPFWKLLLRFFMFSFESIRGPSTYFKRLHKEFSTKSLLLSIFPKINLSILFPTLILTVSFVNFAAIFSLFIGYFTMVEPFCFLYPSLKVKEKTLVAQEPNPAIIRYYLEKGKDKESDWLSFTHGIDLRGRDLRFADFTKSKLFKADLRSAKLQGSNLKKTQLQEANLQGAQLQGTDLVHSQLQGSNLQNARLKWANLEFSRLRYSDLRNAHLERANLLLAQLQGANLAAAKLQETNLSLAQLQGAFLTMATLQGAVLFGTQLQGASLYGSKLQGADLQYAELQGAILWNAKLQGSDLRNALLQGAALGHAQLQGTDLAHAEFQGAVLWKAQLRGANLMDAQFEGIWGGVDLNTSVRWEVLLEEVLTKLPKLKKREFINNIKDAEKRTQNFDTVTALERFKTQITLKQFLENRNRLVCQDAYIAKGIFRQYDRFSDVQLSEVLKPNITEEILKKDLREYIEQNCPEVMKKREW